MDALYHSIGVELSREEFLESVQQFQDQFGSVSTAFSDTLDEDIMTEPLEFEVTPHYFHILFLAHLKLQRDFDGNERLDFLSRTLVESIRDYFWNRLHPKEFDKYLLHTHFVN